MVSRVEVWRRRVRRDRTNQELPVDPRARLLERVVGPASVEFQAWLQQPLAAAAVLVGLFDRPQGPSVLLTQRAAHLVHHPGQISFPGGRILEGETVEEAALREAAEEVGLASRQAAMLTSLPEQMTGSGFRVAPVVALLADDFRSVPDPAEVAGAFELPLAHVRRSGVWRQRQFERLGTRFVSDECIYQEHRIWGATAHILRDLLREIDD